MSGPWRSPPPRGNTHCAHCRDPRQVVPRGLTARFWEGKPQGTCSTAAAGCKRINCLDSARGRRGLRAPGRTSPPRALAPPLGTPFCGVFGREGGTETARVVGFGPGRDPPGLSGETGPRRLQKPATASASAPHPPYPATA